MCCAVLAAREGGRLGSVGDHPDQGERVRYRSDQGERVRGRLLGEEVSLAFRLQDDINVL